MRRWQRGLIVGAAIGLAGVALGFTHHYQSFETRSGLYLLFHLRGVRTPPAEVAVVAIDGHTGGKLGLPDLPREWSRSHPRPAGLALAACYALAVYWAFDHGGH